MKPGKISEPILKRSVIKTIKYETDKILAKAAPGNDAVIADSKGIIISTFVAGLYMSEDNFVFDCKSSIINAMNNVAAKGGCPFAVLLDIILPSGKLESDLRNIMGSLSNICQELKLQISGGNTEVSERVKSTVVSFTVMGYPIDGNLAYQNPKSICSAGMSIVMTKHIGIMGTGILIHEKQEELLTRFHKSYLDKALEAAEELSVINEAAVAVDSDVAVMHDVSRGGIFSALWELSEITGKGVEARIDKIPVKQETIEICECYGLNPYKLISGGSLLIVCENANELICNMQRQSISAAVIGRLTKGNDKVVIQNEEKRFLEPPKSDEIYKIIGNSKSVIRIKNFIDKGD